MHEQASIEEYAVNDPLHFSEVFGNSFGITFGNSRNGPLEQIRPLAAENPLASVLPLAEIACWIFFSELGPCVVSVKLWVRGQSSVD
jgi:hypothetical protein